MARLIQLLLVVTLSALVSSGPTYRSVRSADSSSSSSSGSSEELHRVVRTPSQFDSDSAEDHHRVARTAGQLDSDSSSGSSSSEELHRLVRSPHHDGTDHDHEAEEKTDQDHEHPVLSGDAKKVAIGGDATKPKAKRDTTNDDKAKEGDHSATSTKGKDAEDDKPEHLKLKESTKLIGGGRVVRDTPTTKSPAVLAANAPGPLLLHGEPLHTHVLLPIGGRISSEEKTSEEHTKTKRESPTYPPPPATQKYGNPLVQPHLDPTPPPGYKPKYRRDTDAADVKQSQDLPLSDPNHPARASQPKPQDPNHSAGANQHKRETEQKDVPLGAPPPQATANSKEEQAATANPKEVQSSKNKRDISDAKLTGPLSPPAPIHIKTEDGRDAVIALPPRPGGPQSHRLKREPPSSPSGGPPAPIHIKTEDGRDAVIALPPRPGGPQSHRLKREPPSPTGGPPPPVHIKLEDGREADLGLPVKPGPPQHKRDTSDAKLSGPLSPPAPQHVKTEDGREASIALPPRPAGPQSPKQKRDTTGQQPQQHSHDSHTTGDVKSALLAGPPGPLTKEVKLEEEHDKKEEHKQKRDSYSVDHKDETPESPLHEQSETKESKLTPPTQESEYNRHARDTDKDSSKSVGTHPEPPKSDEKHDGSKVKSSEEKEEKKGA